MKINKLHKTPFLLVIILTINLSVLGQADISSPYSRFGLGMISDNPANTMMKGMGGLSNAILGGNILNPANPASYAFIDSLTFLLDAGFYIKMASYRTMEMSENGSNASFDYASMGFGVTKWWKMGIGIAPYSSRDYNVVVDLYNPGSYSINFTGDGGLNQAFFANGFRITKNISVGAKVSYVFGTLSTETMIYYPDSTYMLNGRRTIDMKVSDFKFDYGIIFVLPMKNEYSLTLGLNYTQEAKINGKRDIFIRSMFNGFGNSVENPIDTLKYRKDEKVSFKLPQGIGAGVVLKKGERWMLGVDFNWDNWKGFEVNAENDSLQNSWNIAVGGQYKPETTSLSGFLRKMTYRAGFHYDRTYFNIYDQSIDKFGFTIGLGIPFPRSLTSFNVALEFGKMGTIEHDLIRENYFNISIGMSIHDRWFVKRKYK